MCPLLCTVFDSTSSILIFPHLQEEIDRVNKEAESLQRPAQDENELPPEQAVAQVAMWRSLMKIFQLKCLKQDKKRREFGYLAQ
ncbi:unnamed protein product [Gongylonema pulchrum]|uniref:AATF-Che1 domain-containing protein n=1 Tax=Gongylonema pulchrum TaxID=637853 RepID=A0A183ES04_9BILA|nr:unnamed protein product [Gongylonema pulchrum]